MTNETISQYTWIIFRAGDEMKARPKNPYLNPFNPTPMCRDCADEDGTCPNNNGAFCDPDLAKPQFNEFEQFALSNTFPAINLPEGEIEGSELEIVDQGLFEDFPELKWGEIGKLRAKAFSALGIETRQAIRPKQQSLHPHESITSDEIRVYTRDEVETIIKQVLERAAEEAYKSKGIVINSILNTPYKDMLK
jgi:hypothetical protein